MTDIDRLTVVIAVGFVMLVGRLPEEDSSQHGLARLTLSLALSAFQLALMSVMVFRALGWLP